MSTSTVSTSEFTERLAWIGHHYDQAYDQRAMWSVGGMYGLEPNAVTDVEQLESAIRHLVVTRAAVILQGERPDERARQALKRAQEVTAAISSMIKVTWNHSPLGDPWRHDEVVFLANVDAYQLTQSIKKAGLQPSTVTD